MTEDQDDTRTDERPAAAEQAAPVSRWRVLVALMFAFIVAYVGFVLWRALVPAQWEFSIEAETEVAELALRPQTRTQWQVDGVVLCSRDPLELENQYRVNTSPNPCGSRAWHAWQVPAPEQVLELGGDAAVTLQVRPEGGLAMSLRASDSVSLGTFSVVGVIDDVALGNAINLIWTDVPAQSLTFPFSGATTLGRAVGWSNAAMLRTGTVSIFTSDESADKRTLVDETSLMLGDQVSLGDELDNASWPKGFARMMPGEDILRIVAFGHADRLRIDRYGESGYELKPGRFRKLVSDPAVAFLGSLLAAYMTLILALQPFVNEERSAGPGTDVLKNFNAWLRRERGAS